MPTYEYECKECGHAFEVFQAMSDPPLKDCPECGKEVRRLIFGGAGVIFKGSGFYVTDKGGKTEKPVKSKSGAAVAEAGVSPSCAACPANTGSKDSQPGCPAAVNSESKTA
jgi:putative FmdB family regulatory protein